MNDLVKTIEGDLAQIEVKFSQMAEIYGAVTFKKECSFAIQHLMKNDLLYRTAKENPNSLNFAILNVAAIGITLCPVKKLAYLVPRKGEVVLDVSYMGLCYLGQASGAIEWSQAKIVREKDIYEARGIGLQPEHRYNSFLDRGGIVGVYSVTKTSSGDFLTEEMSMEQISFIMGRSEGYKAYKDGKIKSNPWITDFEEMAKKTVIKRASKLWPKTQGSDRLSKAVDLSNKIDGIDFEAESRVPPCSKEKRDRMLDLLSTLDRTMEEFLPYAQKIIIREASPEDFTDQEADKLLVVLEDMSSKLQKQKKSETEKENESNDMPDITVEDIKF